MQSILCHSSGQLLSTPVRDEVAAIAAIATVAAIAMIAMVAAVTAVALTSAHIGLNGADYRAT